MVLFRDLDLGVPTLPLFLEFFNVKPIKTEGFLYASKRTNSRKLISDIPTSHKHWKESFFFIGGTNWEFTPADKEDVLGIPKAWTRPENLGEPMLESLLFPFFSNHEFLTLLRFPDF